MESLTLPIQAASISISLLAAGGIATLSLFDIPLVRAQPASRALPSIRWRFSRGSDIFPTCSVVTTIGFAYLAINTLPESKTVVDLLRFGSQDLKLNGYLAAAVLNFAISPWTIIVMVRNNFDLIEMNEKKGGSRSQKSAKSAKHEPGERTADDSVSGKGDPNQFTDLSGPQAKTKVDSTPEEDARVAEMAAKFGRQNSIRAILCGLGGIVGLLAALS